MAYDRKTMKIPFRSSSPSYETLGHNTKETRNGRRTVFSMSSARTQIFLAINVILLISLVSFLVGRWSTHSQVPHYSIELPVVTKTLEYTSSYVVRPSNASEDLWDSLFPKGGTFFTHLPEVPARSTLSVFHQLHCVDAIRRGYYLAYDAAQAGERLVAADIGEMESEAHVKHCLDLIRQSLMCMGDRTIELKNEAGGVTGFGTTHQCVDYAELVRRIEGWHEVSGDGKDERSMHGHQHGHQHDR